MHDERSAISMRNQGVGGRVTKMFDRCRYAVTAAPHDGTVPPGAYYAAAGTADVRQNADIASVSNVSMPWGRSAGRDGMPVRSPGGVTSRGRSRGLRHLPAERRPGDADLPLDRGKRQWGPAPRRGGSARGHCQIKFATSSAPALCGILAV